MKTLTIEEIAERRLAYIKRLRALAAELNAECNQLREAMTQAAYSLLKAASNEEEE